MAVRTLRTPEKEAAVLDALRVKGNASRALTSVKLSRSTWYQWLHDDPALMAAHKEAFTVGRENRADRAEDKLGDKVEEGDVTAIIFTLKTLRREIYGDKSVHELTGKDGAPLVIHFAQREDGPA